MIKEIVMQTNYLKILCKCETAKRIKVFWGGYWVIEKVEGHYLGYKSLEKS